MAQARANRSLDLLVLQAIRDQMAPAGNVFRRSLTMLAVCRSICGQIQHALPAAAAIEFFVAALDVLDDIEDEDNEMALWKRHGRALALNASTALLMLAQLAAARLRLKSVSNVTVARAMEMIASSGAMACAGQHYDIEYESRPSISEAQYFKMIGMKSAALVECASRIGALLAGADDRQIESLGMFGRYLGIAYQIENDVDSISSQQAGKSDITKRKKTLPVVFALSNADEEARDWLASIYSAREPIGPELESKVSQLLGSCGAVHYSIIRAEMYRRKAAKVLADSGIPHGAVRSMSSALGL